MDNQYCGAIIYKKDKLLQVLLVYNLEDGVNFWQLPKGKKISGESDRDTLRRVILDDTGYVLGDSQPIESLKTQISKINTVIKYYLCTSNKSLREKEKQLDTRWVEYKKALALLTDFGAIENEDKILKLLPVKLY